MRRPLHGRRQLSSSRLVPQSASCRMAEVRRGDGKLDRPLYDTCARQGGCRGPSYHHHHHHTAGQRQPALAVRFVLWSYVCFSLVASPAQRAMSGIRCLYTRRNDVIYGLHPGLCGGCQTPPVGLPRVCHLAVPSHPPSLPCRAASLLSLVISCGHQGSLPSSFLLSHPPNTTRSPRDIPSHISSVPGCVAMTVARS